MRAGGGERQGTPNGLDRLEKNKNKKQKKTASFRTGKGHAHMVVQQANLAHGTRILELGSRALFHAKHNNLLAANTHLLSFV